MFQHIIYERGLANSYLITKTVPRDNTSLALKKETSWFLLIFLAQSDSGLYLSILQPFKSISEYIMGIHGCKYPKSLSLYLKYTHVYKIILIFQ